MIMLLKYHRNKQEKETQNSINLCNHTTPILHPQIITIISNCNITISMMISSKITMNMMIIKEIIQNKYNNLKGITMIKEAVVSCLPLRTDLRIRFLKLIRKLWKFKKLLIENLICINEITFREI